MAIEDFTTYTEVDPNSRITVISTRVTWSSLTKNEDAYVYDDKGAGYFAGSFEIKFTANLTASQGGNPSNRIQICALANAIDDGQGIILANEDMLSVFFSIPSSGTPSIFLEECDGGSTYSGGSYVCSENTDYDITLLRDEGVGTYGTLYCYIYSDSSRTNLLDTLTVTLHSSKKDFQYLYVCQSFNTGQSITTSGYVDSVEITLGSAPTVTTQAVTNISGTTATGNGTITSLGFPNPSAHGVCWNTTGTPTTADSKTDEGAASATGAFTSSMTGLVDGTKYYVRAYATNSEGTGYGAETSFRAGIPIGSEVSGVFEVVETRLHYVDAYGNERYIEGTLV